MIWLLGLIPLLAAAQDGGSSFHWTASVQAAHLSNQQRLLSEVDVLVDGAYLAKRRGKGELLILVRITDSDGRVYKQHGTIDLVKVEEGLKKSDVTYSQPLFVRPGEYTVEVELYNTETKERSLKKMSLRAAALKNDPLPQAWNKLPPIEFVTPAGTPDSWYLPDISERLNLRVETKKASRIEVLVNLTPSERASGSFRIQDRNLSALLPAMRALSEIEGPGLSINISLLDLARRKVTFRQEHVGELDWPGMRAALGETTPGSIDVKSLEDRTHNAQFFVSEVARLAKAVGKDGAVIVLSGPVEFETGQELGPIEAAPSSGRIIYIRYLTQVRRLAMMPPDPRMMGRRPQGISAPGPRIPIDHLFDKLKPLGPELVEVHTAEDFRKALAGLMGEIEKL